MSRKEGDRFNSEEREASDSRLGGFGGRSTTFVMSSTPWGGRPSGPSRCRPPPRGPRDHRGRRSTAGDPPPPCGERPPGGREPEVRRGPGPSLTEWGDWPGGGSGNGAPEVRPSFGLDNSIACQRGGDWAGPCFFLFSGPPHGVHLLLCCFCILGAEHFASQLLISRLFFTHQGWVSAADEKILAAVPKTAAWKFLSPELYPFLTPALPLRKFFWGVSSKCEKKSGLKPFLINLFPNLPH